MENSPYFNLYMGLIITGILLVCVFVFYFLKGLSYSLKDDAQEMEIAEAIKIDSGFDDEEHGLQFEQAKAIIFNIMEKEPFSVKNIAQISLDTQLADLNVDEEKLKDVLMETIDGLDHRLKDCPETIGSLIRRFMQLSQLEK